MSEIGLNRVCAVLVIVVGWTGARVSAESEQAFKTPKIEGEYVAVYRPAGDRFAGPDTTELKAGQWYADWVPNDHAILKGPDGRWHAFGITHPLTSTDRVHEGEFQSFHAVAPIGSLKEVLRDGVWKDFPKVLPPSERPGEILPNHAPSIVEKDGLYHMIYGPSPIRLATSPDLMKWTPKGVLFHERSGARDPSVMLWEGTYYMVFCTEDRVGIRTSKDLVDWSESRALLRMKAGVAPESPSMVRFEGSFYLFVCGWNGIWDRKMVEGAYQHQTYVYRSDDPLSFDGAREVARVESHAPEVFQGEDGTWYISSVEWPQRGVSIARLRWQ
ncbi:family 43 glycosylhydrolase [Planctomycetota bacterium]